MSIHSDELYQQVILEHNKRPRNFLQLDPCTHQAEGYNPLCGDHLNVYLRVSDQGMIEELSFLGDGCAISKASASMMTAALKGKTVEEAGQLFQEFRHLLTKELDPEKDPHSLGKLTVFSGIWKYPSRVKCAVLAWRTMKGALDQEKTIATE
ncbi:MAG: SUF system NifU family Fe-S cluster assembly protein [Candidatus Omnitrophica bacterium]|nr:SUF system NifU family Fe-S cluster assembly protein [Candidatus Omnitrophota bacterium]